MKNARNLYLLLILTVSLLSLLDLAPVTEVSGAPATPFTVNSAGDENDDFTGDGICDDGTGKCTLRAAIEESNALKVESTIYFSLPSPTTIYLDNSLGYVDYADIIGPLDLGITLDGQNSTSVGTALRLASSKSTSIENLRLQNFTGPAIVTENFAGTDQIRNNIIINSGMSGIRVSGQQTVSSSGSIIIIGNYIGFDPINGIAGPNGSHGIEVNIRNGASSGSIVRIGGNLPEDRNVISGNTGSGIYVFSQDPDAETQILGNYIGTDDSGTIEAANLKGIWIDRHPGILTIGGSTAAHGNLVAGNDREGIIVDESVNATLQFNTLSTNSDETGYLSNGSRDITVTNSSLVSIDDNVALQGIAINGSETFPVTEVSINRNYVGITRSDFVRPVSTTGVGIYTKYMYEACQIGYNRITGFRTGIHVDDGTFTSIIANKIFDISGLGIDIDPWLQINPNDPLDADEGPNHMQNFPTLTVVKTAVMPFYSYDITVHLHSTPNTMFRVEVFSSDVCFPGGYGEGEEMEKFSNGVMTDSSGNATWQVATLWSYEVLGECFTATASKVITTGVYGSTSEFSRDFAYIFLPAIIK